jgi:hypothetical protein
MGRRYAPSGLPPGSLTHRRQRSRRRYARRAGRWCCNTAGEDDGGRRLHVQCAVARQVPPWLRAGLQGPRWPRGRSRCLLAARYLRWGDAVGRPGAERLPASRLHCSTRAATQCRPSSRGRRGTAAGSLVSRPGSAQHLLFSQHLIDRSLSPNRPSSVLLLSCECGFFCGLELFPADWTIGTKTPFWLRCAAGAARDLVGEEGVRRGLWRLQRSVQQAGCVRACAATLQLHRAEGPLN